jgi:surface-adhesin protein E
MRWILVGLSAVMVASAGAAATENWVPVMKGDFGAASIDVANVQSNRSLRTFNYNLVIFKPQPYARIASQFQIDCAANAIKSIHTAAYDKDGKVVATFGEDKDWETIAPDHTAQLTMRKLVC